MLVKHQNVFLRDVQHNLLLCLKFIIVSKRNDMILVSSITIDKLLFSIHTKRSMLGLKF